MGHRAQVIDFIGLHFLYDPDDIGCVGQVPVVQYEIAVVDVRVLVEVIDAPGIEERTSPFDAVHDVSFLQQKLREVCTILSGDTRDQSCLHRFNFGLIKNWVTFLIGFMKVV